MHQISDDTLSKLLGLAMANGIDLGLAPDGSDAPDLKPIFPTVDLKRAVSEIAHETGMNVKNSGLYLFGKRLVLVDAAGQVEDMDADLFRTWIDSFQLNWTKRKKGDEDEGPGMPIKTTMKKDVAAVLIRSNEFRCHIPEIRRILPVRLPVFENHDDIRGIRMLPYGYDPETKIFTGNSGIEYLENWTMENAVKYLRGLLQDFPYADGGRSLSVQISAMLTVYCQLLFAERDRWPMIYYNANLPGSGKTKNAEMCCYPVYGDAEPITYGENDEFVKKLDTWAQAGRAYTLLDDVSGLVRNNDLNRWLTSSTWSGRIMHKQSMFTVLNQTLTLLTGNQATLSDDLTRRSLMVDLWSAEPASARQGKLKCVIDAEWLANPQNRADMLSAMYALVHHWSFEGEQKSYGKLIPSFEGWSRIVPAIVTMAGFDCPLQAPDVEDAGGKQEVEFCRLMELAVKDYMPEIGKPVDILLTDWCRLARSIGVFHNIVADMPTMKETMDGAPTKYYKPLKDKMGNTVSVHDLSEAEKELQAYRFMERTQNTKFGGILHKFYRGQIRTINGRRYKFADRKARHSTFILEQLPAEEEKTAA